MHNSNEKSKKKQSQDSEQKNERKLNELSQMMVELKDELFRLQTKNSSKEAKEEGKPTSSHQQEDEMKARKSQMPKTPRTPPPRSPPPGRSLPSRSPPPERFLPPPERSLPPPERSLPPARFLSPPPARFLSPPPPRCLSPMSYRPRSPPPMSLPHIPYRPMSPPPPPMSMTMSRRYQRGNSCHRSHSYVDPRRMHMRPDPAKSNILKAALRIVAELDYNDLKHLERNLQYQVSLF